MSRSAVPIVPTRDVGSPTTQMRTLHMKRDLANKSRDALSNFLAAIRQIDRDSEASELLLKCARDSVALEQSLDSSTKAINDMTATLGGMSKRMGNICRSVNELPSLLLYFDDMERINNKPKLGASESSGISPGFA